MAADRINKAVLALLLTMPILLLWIGTHTDLDLILADAAFDRDTGAFPWRHAWLTEVFSHRILKHAFIALAVGFVLMAGWDLISPRPWPGLRRRQMRVVALSAIVIPTVISLLKQVSSSHCPWDLARYGGSAPYVRLLQALPLEIEPGRCMPAGHASSALWLISLAVFFLPRRPVCAAAVFGFFLTVGFGVGWLQQLRGAHFLTHTLWSIWIACAVVCALFATMVRRSF